MTDENFKNFLDAIPKVKKIVSTGGITTNAYVKTLKHKDFDVMFRLMYGCGLRISEVINLKTGDFNLEKKELTIRTKKGNQYTTILPSDISMLKEYLPSHNEKIFKITRETAWLYAKAIGKAANLNYVIDKKSSQVQGVFNHLFRESRRRIMQQTGSMKELIDLKLRSFSDTNYANYTLDDLKDWESQFEFLPSYGIVILGDILGTKGVWKEKNVSSVIRKWNDLVTRVKNYLEDEELFIEKFSIKAFSDTIVILGQSSDVDKLVVTAGKFLKTFLHVCLLHDFPIRGCFSIGQFVNSDNMIIGPGVDEAASFYEKSNWIGFSATPSSYSVLERLASDNKLKSKIDNIFTKYDVPMKSGIDKQNWVVKIDPTVKLTDDAGLHSEFSGMDIGSLCHYKLEHPVNPDGSIKWRNTLKFLKSPENILYKTKTST